MAGRLSAIRAWLLHWGLREMGPRRRRLLAWRALRATGAREVTFERDGVVWTSAADDDAIGFFLFSEGGYQTAEIEALRAWMRRCDILSAGRDVLVDVGANLGSTCIPLVRATGCRALAIEPTAENFRRLTLNVNANGLADRILLARRAVQRTPGSITMCLAAGCSGGHFVRRDASADLPPVALAGYEEVEAAPLAAIVDAAGLRVEEIALVWADVQGCEAEVIESGAPLWGRGVPLWAEIEPTSLALQGSLAVFADVAAAHFDRFIPAQDLLRFGEAAPARPIAELGALIGAITPEQCNTDVLFLPPLCPAGARRRAA